VRVLQAELAAAGFDLSAIFPAGAYNKHAKIAERKELHIEAPNDNTLAMVVANTAALWEPFIRHIKSSSEGAELLASDDPLDDYTRAIFKRLLDLVAPDEEAKIVFAFETIETTGRCCSVHTAGHVAGLAYYDAAHTMRSIHPVYGPWFGYRAVITFPKRLWSKALPGGGGVGKELASPCPETELMEVSNVQTDVLGKWGAVSEAESWAGLLRVTDTFKIGAEHRYSEPQARFHYAADKETRRAVLKECTA